jgi:hypothetical protein
MQLELFNLLVYLNPCRKKLCDRGITEVMWKDRYDFKLPDRIRVLLSVARDRVDDRRSPAYLLNREA